MTIRKISFVFTAVLAALLLAACSEDDALPPSVPGGGDEGLQTYTLTAGVDYTITEVGSGNAAAYSAGTRATADTDDAPTRFYAQAVYGTGSSAVLSAVVEGVLNADGKYEFTFQLYSGREYTYLFWADNAPTETAVPVDLRNVAYTIGTVAFAATAQGTPDTVTKDITLTHAVTKVTLRTSAVVTVAAGGSVGITTNCGTGYNVLNSEVTSSSSLLLTKTFDAAATFNAGDDVASLYFLPTSTKQQDVTIRNFRLLERTLPDIPLAANRHVTLQGDLNTDDENWATTNAYIESQFRSYFFNEDGTQISDVLSGNADDITALFKVITRDENYSLQNGLEYIYGIQGSFHNYLYIYNYTTYYIIGFADNDATYAWSVYTDPWYEPFPKPNE